MLYTFIIKYSRLDGLADLKGVFLFFVLIPLICAVSQFKTYRGLIQYLGSVMSKKIFIKDYYGEEAYLHIPHQDAGQQVTSIWKTEERDCVLQIQK